MSVVRDLSLTARADGGFGSTGVRALRELRAEGVREVRPGLGSGTPGEDLPRRVRVAEVASASEVGGGGTDVFEGLGSEGGSDLGPRLRRGGAHGHGARSDTSAEGTRVLWHTVKGEVFHCRLRCQGDRYQMKSLVACERCFGPNSEWPPTYRIEAVLGKAHRVASGCSETAHAKYRELRPCLSCVRGASFAEGGGARV